MIATLVRAALFVASRILDSLSRALTKHRSTGSAQRSLAAESPASDRRQHALEKRRTMVMV
jgi:hypothetical protein